MVGTPLAPSAPLNRRELVRYARRVQDRFPLERAVLGGTRVSGAAVGEPYVLVLVSPLFDGIPWLERLHQTGALWDAAEMGDRADVHCYTPVEVGRKARSVPAVREALAGGVDLLAP